MTTSLTDIEFMRNALAMAQRGLGRVAPNPSVGCVIVKNGHVIARACTGDGGRPHAETIALEIVGERAQGATAYVTLEPCAHHGKTPPCCEALAASGLARVVVACTDIDPRVLGKGIQYFKEAGIDVEFGVLEEEARALNAGFFSRVEKIRPFISMKMAVSRDGKITEKEGQRTQITGEMAGRYVHMMRGRHDAILVGANTVLTDDPLLTARLEGQNHNIVRVVLDTNLQVSLDSQLVQSASVTPLWFFCGSEVNEERRSGLEEQGVHVFTEIELENVLKTLSQQGVTRLMVEGGSQVNASFLEGGFADELTIIQSADELGAQGLEAISGHDLDAIEGEFGLTLTQKRPLEQDLLAIYASKD